MSAPRGQKGPFWMGDAPAIPRGFRAKIRWVIDHHPWIWLLVGVEQLSTGHYISGMVFIGIFIANLFIYETWERLSRAAKVLLATVFRRALFHQEIDYRTQQTEIHFV
jgi:hypothetical protein